MAMNIAQVNQADVLKLADLMQQKELLIRDMKNAVKRLNDDALIVVVEVENPLKTNPLRDNERLRAAIDSQSEWIIDRIYDTAIHNLETEIAILAEKLMKNLIESHKP